MGRGLTGGCVVNQRASVTVTRVSAGSTWSCTSCQDTSVEESVRTVATTRTAVTATTASKDSTAVETNLSIIARPASVRTAPPRLAILSLKSFTNINVILLCYIY